MTDDGGGGGDMLEVVHSEPEGSGGTGPPPHTLKSLCDSLSRFRGEAGCKLGRRAPSTAILIPPGSFCPLYNPSAGASGSGGAMEAAGAHKPSEDSLVTFRVELLSRSHNLYCVYNLTKCFFRRCWRDQARGGDGGVNTCDHPEALNPPQ